ncbi:hypothetical protein [Rubritalea marina]|uniref:capsular polysaccharide export protein, LipB/KpsS family n=1 Tax=Rubritalea marina TaxID=361055 RepID=UPI001969D876|nr:hypothetical protein [Rubritalea marina]
MEILTKAIKKGHKVTAVIPHWSHVLADTVAPCYTPDDLETESKAYVDKMSRVYSMVSDSIEVIEAEPIKFEGEFEEWLQDVFENIESLGDLSEQTFHGFDVGSAAVSSFVSWTRLLDVSVKQEWGRLRPLLCCAYAQYRLTCQYTDALNPRVVLTFNGRFASSRGVLRASREKRIHCWLHERGADKAKYHIFKNYLPHDQKAFRASVRRWSMFRSRFTLASAAKSFYGAKRLGADKGWVSFVKDQNFNELPKGWDEERHNVVIFNSSEDEFVAIGKEWANPIYSSQCEAIDRLLSDIDDENIHFWLRMHPNLKDVCDQELLKWNQLDEKYDNLTVISPESKVSSYALLDAASKVLTFGSTMGAEASYWGKPSVIAGTSFYKGLNAAHAPRSHNGVVSMIGDKSLTSSGKKGAIKYGAYAGEFGTSMEYVKVHSFEEVEYMGQEIPKRAVG